MRITIGHGLARSASGGETDAHPWQEDEFGVRSIPLRGWQKDLPTVRTKQAADLVREGRDQHHARATGCLVSPQQGVVPIRPGEQI